MTQKIYRSAMGKPVDLGALLLQNEQVRAVGNMNVNARGDILDGNNTVIDSKNRQLKRQYKKTTKPATVVATSSRAAKKMFSEQQEQQSALGEDLVTEPLPTIESVIRDPAPVDEAPRGGLAAAIARSREIKQELDKTPRQLRQSQQLKKI